MGYRSSPFYPTLWGFIRQPTNDRGAKLEHKKPCGYNEGSAEQITEKLSTKYLCYVPCYAQYNTNTDLNKKINKNFFIYLHYTTQGTNDKQQSKNSLSSLLPAGTRPPSTATEGSRATSPFYPSSPFYHTVPYCILFSSILCQLLFVTASLLFGTDAICQYHIDYVDLHNLTRSLITSHKQHLLWHWQERLGLSMHDRTILL